MPSKGKSSNSRAGMRKDRNVRYATREPILGYYLIVTDTEETEKNYFQGLKNSIPKAVGLWLSTWLYGWAHFILIQERTVSHGEL